MTVDVLAAPDPVGAVLDAHAHGHLVALRTSGTTQRPRAVVRTTDSWWASFDAYSALAEISEASRVWVPGPLTSTMNLFAAVHARVVGAGVVESASGCTHAVLTPALLARLLPDLGGCLAIVAGDRLDPALSRAAEERGVRTAHYYGSAEQSFVAWGTHAEDLRPFPGVEVEVRDGVIWTRSPYSALLTSSTDSEVASDAGSAGPGEWVTVGDRGEWSDDRLLVHGRGAEAVTTAGATVLVADVEAALADVVPGVTVVGVPHPDLGAVLCAVLPPGSDAEAARAAARTRLAPAWRPRRWFEGSVPLTEAGKVDRAALAATLTAALATNSLPRLR